MADNMSFCCLGLVIYCYSDTLTLNNTNSRFVSTLKRTGIENCYFDPYNKKMLDKIETGFFFPLSYVRELICTANGQLEIWSVK